MSSLLLRKKLARKCLKAISISKKNKFDFLETWFHTMIVSLLSSMKRFKGEFKCMVKFQTKSNNIFLWKYF